MRLTILAVVIVQIASLVMEPTRENVLAVTGALAIAVGFAFKDYLSSVMAGALGLFERPLRVGDWEERVEERTREVEKQIAEKKKAEMHLLRVQRMESIGALASGITHDLNNILTPIMIGVGVLRMRHNELPNQSLLATLQSSVERGADMVRQILTFARGEEGRHFPLQVRSLVNELVKLLRQSLPKSLVIEDSLPNDLWPVLGDSTQIHQVLTNLCVNARDAMPEGGHLWIRASNLEITEKDAPFFPEAKTGRHVVLEVQDTGTGIPPALVEQIFEPFFTTKKPGQGTGLGLATVQTITKNHGGFVRVQSEMGEGTKFVIYLPAMNINVVTAEKAACPALPEGRGEVILVVEDEVALREVAVAMLSAAGYQVITARNGAEALALFAQEGKRIHVVLTDMMMPIMDGRATVKALRKLDDNVKIIAVSGLADAAEALGLGAKAMLHKPYTAEALLGTLRSVLDSSN